MKLIQVLVFTLFTLPAISQKSTKMIISVNNIDVDTFILARSHEDLRYNGIEIPVTKDESVEYSLSHSYIEEYALVFKSELKKGAWRPIVFFPNSTQIEFELFPSEEYNKNSIVGDELGRKKRDYQTSFGNQFMEVGNNIYGTFFQSEENSDERKEAKSRLDSLNRAVLKFHNEYFKNDNSLLGLNEYVELLQNADQMMISPETFQEYHENYIRQEFDHPLIERANNLYAAISSIKVGEIYIDITLKSLENESISLSQKINKKQYTLLDLWAPWCGPCIRKSKSVKESYNKFNNKLNVIGVVGGIDSKDLAIKAIDKYNYPWDSYLEISDENSIWEKYGISNSGGSQYLIDFDGTIISINPTIDEIESILNN